MVVLPLLEEREKARKPSEETWAGFVIGISKMTEGCHCRPLLDVRPSVWWKSLRHFSLANISSESAIGSLLYYSLGGTLRDEVKEEKNVNTMINLILCKKIVQRARPHRAL